MKKVVIAIASVMMLASCSTTEGGAMSGAMFGSMIGSSIGGLSGGPRGSDLGQLIGIVAGGAAGAAVGHSKEKKVERIYEQQDDMYRQQRAQQQSSQNSSYGSDTERSEQPIYNDVIDMQPASDADFKAETQQPVISTLNAAPLQISNVRFINNDGTEHIGRGELVKIQFEIRNTTSHAIIGIAPEVLETTGNKRLMVSPTAKVESLEAGKAIRYTAYVSAQNNLKKGMASFTLKVYSGGEMMSNIVQFDIPLN